MSKSISEQVVVLVGATSGIGMDAALQFGKRGAKLVLAGRSEAELRNVLTQVRELGSDGISVTADVTHWEQVKAIVDQAVATYGRIDTWVNLAAVSVYAAFATMTPDEFKQIMDVNFLGQVYGAMAVLPVMREQGSGTIIFISSTEARIPIPLHSAYSASKHAVDAFSRSLRMELEHALQPIQITNILPSSVNTPFFAKSMTKLGVKPRPMPPVYEASAVSQAILYAAEHPIAEIMVGSSGHALHFVNRFSPRLADTIVKRIGFDLQQSSEIKSADAPSNLYEHLPGFNQVQGEFSSEARSASMSTWLNTHPFVRLGIASLAFGATSYFVLRSVLKSR
ncbi:MAG TPA: SDR family oxidoreductase [Anaerolineaceae bacterium]|nr:SDR family oxidoreductase [Anaerolineaceae bacterium]